MKYTFLFGTRSLSRSHRFLDFLFRSPQSWTKSQYVQKIAARTEATPANILRMKLWFLLLPEPLAVLKQTAIIVNKYLTPLYPCSRLLSSIIRRMHWRQLNNEKHIEYWINVGLCFFFLWRNFFVPEGGEIDMGLQQQCIRKFCRCLSLRKYFVFVWILPNRSGICRTRCFEELVLG